MLQLLKCLGDTVLVIIPVIGPGGGGNRDLSWHCPSAPLPQAWAACIGPRETK